MIIAIEGGDANGKATQSKLLAEHFGLTRISFPDYETPAGKLILELLKEECVVAVEETDPESKQRLRKDDGHRRAMVLQSLMTVNRLERLPDIQVAIKSGGVVFDRYWQSGVVYGGLDGLNREWLMKVQRDIMPSADVNILLDVPVEESFRRRPERRDRYEKDRPFLEKVRAEYLNLWKFGNDANHWGMKNWHVVNGLGTIREVHTRIAKSLTKDFYVDWTPSAGWGE